MGYNQDEVLSYVENLITGIAAFEIKKDKWEIKCLYRNEGLSRMLGYHESEIDKYIEKIRYLIVPDDLPNFDLGIKETLKADGYVDTYFRTITGSGSLRWLHLRSNLYSQNEESCVIVSIIIDVTERKNSEQELKEQAMRLHLIADEDKYGIFDYNVKSDVLTLREPDENGREKEKIISDYIEKFNPNLVDSEYVERYLSALERLTTKPGHETLEIKCRIFDEEFNKYEINLSSLMGLEGYVTRIIGRFVNISKNNTEIKLETNDLDDGTVSFREFALKKFIDGFSFDEVLEDTVKKVLNKLKWGCLGIFPSMESDNIDKNTKIYVMDGENNPFEGESDYSLICAQLQDLSRSINEIKVVTVNEASLYSYSFKRFMEEKKLERIVFYPMYKNGKYCGAAVGFNPLYDREDIDQDYMNYYVKEAEQFINLVNTISLQFEGDLVEKKQLIASLYTLDNLDYYIYLVDYDTKALLFANKKVLDSTAEVKLGMNYYDTLGDTVTEDGEDSLYDLLDTTDVHSKGSKDIFNYGIRTWVKTNVSWYVLNDKQKIFMLSGTDISDYL